MVQREIVVVERRGWLPCFEVHVRVRRFLVINRSGDAVVVVVIVVAVEVLVVVAVMLSIGLCLLWVVVVGSIGIGAVTSPEILLTQS